VPVNYQHGVALMALLEFFGRHAFVEQFEDTEFIVAENGEFSLVSDRHITLPPC
jgi:hypothetical protein